MLDTKKDEFRSEMKMQAFKTDLKLIEFTNKSISYSIWLCCEYDPD